MRALLVVNPAATATTARTRDVLTGALESEVKVERVTTQRSGHAVELARQAVAERLDLVIALGGDGTVNEIVNGLLANGPTAGLPDLAVVPGGSTNVFARTLGVPNEPVEATGLLLEALRRGRRRVINLGRANETYFTFCAGLGLDAEVISLVERHRVRGRRSTHGLYVRCAVRHFLTGTDRRNAALTLRMPGVEDRRGLFLGIVSNSSPWTYLGRRPVRPSPRANLDTGLDLFAADRLGTVMTLRHIAQMLAGWRPPRGRHLVALHDQKGFAMIADRPVAFQVDGDYAGERTRVEFGSVPRALRVIA
jgi:diacylglycerol kinase family enzyme